MEENRESNQQNTSEDCSKPAVLNYCTITRQWEASTCGKNGSSLSSNAFRNIYFSMRPSFSCTCTKNHGPYAFNINSIHDAVECPNTAGQTIFEVTIDLSPCSIWKLQLETCGFYLAENRTSWPNNQSCGRLERGNCTIFSAGSIDMARLMKSLSRKGTRASTPHADVDLLALRQSYRWSAFICTKEASTRHHKCHLLWFSSQDVI